MSAEESISNSNSISQANNNDEAVNPGSELLAEKKKTTVLVVEDEFHIREIIRMTLEMKGYRVQEAVNGKEGLKLVSQYKPDLIVTDILMPVMDGLEFFLMLKEKSETANIPVIVLTVKDSIEDERSALLLGVDEFISKPFDPRDLINKIEGILNKK